MPDPKETVEASTDKEGSRVHPKKRKRGVEVPLRKKEKAKVCPKPKKTKFFPNKEESAKKCLSLRRGEV